MTIARSLHARSTTPAPSGSGAIQVAHHDNGPARRRTDDSAHLREEAEHLSLQRQLMQENKVLTRRFGISLQLFDAMLEVAVCTDPDGIGIGELAMRLGIKHNSVVSIVNKLSVKGLAIRIPCTRDCRRVYVNATPQGKRLLHNLVTEMRKTWTDVPLPGELTRSG